MNDGRSSRVRQPQRSGAAPIDIIAKSLVGETSRRGALKAALATVLAGVLTRCTPAEAGPPCIAGQVCPCPAGSVRCNQGCFRPCTAGRVFNAACQCVCPSGTILCNGQCIRICPGGTINAQCQCVCPSGMVVCGGRCTRSCPSGHVLDATCRCVCPHPCPSGQIHSGNCSCVCPGGAPSCGGACCARGHACLNAAFCSPNCEYTPQEDATCSAALRRCEEDERTQAAACQGKCSMADYDCNNRCVNDARAAKFACYEQSKGANGPCFCHAAASLRASSASDANAAGRDAG